MEHILIADAGSTKVDWAAVETTGKVALRFSTPGLNALMASQSDVEKALAGVRETLGSEIRPARTYYYGAGCATPEICDKMRSSLLANLGGEEAFVTTDLLGAARATLGKRKGIACILGTGSNSCFYDGKEIVTNVPSLGFILGDEGSGAALGKRLVSDAFKGHLPEAVKEKFLDAYKLTLGEILDKIYRQPSPNRFLASLVPFLKENIWNPYVYSLVLKEFTQFFRRNVSRYKGVHSLPISVTGSLATNFENILREAAASQGFSLSVITATPLDGLITFHTEPTDE